jgi:hypothetical protein
MENLMKSFKLDPNVKIGSGKSAGVGRPGDVPADYEPDEDNPLSAYRNVAGFPRGHDLYDDYIYFVDDWNWEAYQPMDWPCADSSFPDFEEDKAYDLWPFKPDLTKVHWINLNDCKAGFERKMIFLGKTKEYEIPEQYVGGDAQKLIVQFEALVKGGDENKVKAAGFKNMDHIRYVISYSKKDLKKAYAETQSFLDEANKKSQQQMNSNVDAAKKGGLLDPIKGISMEDWAAANVKIGGGMPLNDVLKVLGVEKPVWDEVAAEWMSRMQQDTTFALAKVYGDAFTNPNIGKFASAGGAAAQGGNEAVEKIKNDFEEYIKIMCHQNMASTQGIDANAILKQYGLTAADWGMVSGHWAPQMATNVNMSMRMAALMDKYNGEFAAPKAGSDIDF